MVVIKNNKHDDNGRSQNMKSIEIMSVGLRLIGIYMGPLFLGSLPRIVVMFHQVQSSTSDSSRFFLIVGVGAVLHLMTMIVLIVYPMRIAKILVPKTKADEVLFEGSAKDVQVALFCVCGVYTLSKALPDLIFNGLWISGTGWNFAGGKPYVISQITTVIEICIGLYLCLQAKGLSELLWRLRNGKGAIVAKQGTESSNF